MVLRVKPTPTRLPTNSIYTLAFYIKCVPPVGLPLQSLRRGEELWEGIFGSSGLELSSGLANLEFICLHYDT